MDWIVLKCLEKDRTRRYATANALAVDIERYLHEEAVLARPPSQLYRLQKLARRNRVAFLFGTAAVAALLLGSLISTLMFFRERDARSSEARLRKEAELREESSRIALLVTQRRFEEADKLLVGIPLDKPSIEVAAELRALGDWHAAKGRWPQAAERFASLVKVNQFDSPEVTSLDQLRLAAALLEAGDRRGYEQWRQSIVARFTQRSRSASGLDHQSVLVAARTTRSARAACGRIGTGHGQKRRCTRSPPDRQRGGGMVLVRCKGTAPLSPR